MNQKPVVSDGNPSPLGCSKNEGLCNFAVFSEHAEGMFLGLFAPGENKPLVEYPMHRTGSVWHIALADLNDSFRYAFRAKGAHQDGLLYNPSAWLADPYAKNIDSHTKWNQRPSSPILATLKEEPSFDWENVEAPLIDRSELIIYEAHVRGFTQHPSSKTSSPGTFSGFLEKILYLKKLGVNAVELMPVFEFDETHCKNVDPKTNQPLPNYWGYNSLHFFVPMKRYACSHSATEFKTLVRELHRNEILVLLDVVYNHTGEGKEKDYYIHFRGLDNKVYYQLLSSGEYRDDTGCGHNVNANHPQVKKFILDSLRYWAEEMHVDGFRFDLCAALIRGKDGKPMEKSPLIEAIEQDPILSKKILIAEAWDASGLYLLGHFSNRGGWHEWNGQYRDHVRRFLKGTDGYAGKFATALSGSEPIYGASKTPLSSINFVTSHDGYSLRDLVSYQHKHNMDNGEKNKDGSDHNDSWNCGIEGLTKDPHIQELREKQMRNFFLALFLSQGLPMLLMGDEYGHTRHGNNNPYVQDNEINWFLWNHSREDIVAFTSALIQFRKDSPHFRRSRFLTKETISWHGHSPGHPDWSKSSRFVAFSQEDFYVAFNADYQPAAATLPEGSWRLLVDTSLSWDKQPLVLGRDTAVAIPTNFSMPPYSAVLLRNRE